MAPLLPPPAGQTSSNRDRSILSLSSSLLNQSMSFVSSSTISVKIFCLCVFIGYLLTFKSATVDYLSVIPGKLLPPNFQIWSLITHSFIEIRLLELLMDWFIIFLYSRMIEPLWGVYECVQFFFVVTSLVAISTSIFYFAVFALSFNEHYLFDIRINGLGGMHGGFLVAIKQIMPDTVILNTSFLRLKQDHLPGLFIILSVMLYVVGLTSLTYVIMLAQGSFIGWIYLRFFQKHKNGTCGDSSSTFVFASFFPSQIQPFIAILANTVFNLLVQMKICKKPPVRYNVAGSGSQSQITITLPLVNAGIENSDAERRRQKALKALKERLKKPGEDVADQWADRDSNEKASLINNDEAAGVASEAENEAQVFSDAPSEPEALSKEVKSEQEAS